MEMLESPPAAQETAPRASSRFVPEQRRCMNCPATFTADRVHNVFCDPACRKAFDARHLSQGRPAAPLLKAWTATRHAKPGTREAEICRFAMSELTAMATDFNAADAKAERSAVDYVETLMRSGLRYVDRAKTR